MSVQPGDTVIRKATAFEAAKAVLWSFLGVRKRADYDRDSVSLSPVQVIVAGLIGGVLFVASLLLVVKLILA